MWMGDLTLFTSRRVGLFSELVAAGKILFRLFSIFDCKSCLNTKWHINYSYNFMVFIEGCGFMKLKQPGAVDPDVSEQTGKSVRTDRGSTLKKMWRESQWQREMMSVASLQRQQPFGQDSVISLTEMKLCRCRNEGFVWFYPDTFSSWSLKASTLKVSRKVDTGSSNFGGSFNASRR